MIQRAGNLVAQVHLGEQFRQSWILLQGNVVRPGQFQNVLRDTTPALRGDAGCAVAVIAQGDGDAGFVLVFPFHALSSNSRGVSSAGVGGVPLWQASTPTSSPAASSCRCRSAR